jgi:hypothetical protein
MARVVGASCHADPFVPSVRPAEQAGLMGRLFGGHGDPRKLQEVA